jgi:hypothetical protein
MGIAPSVCAKLRERGIDAVHLVERLPTTAPDPEIFRLSRSTGEWFSIAWQLY